MNTNYLVLESIAVIIVKVFVRKGLILLENAVKKMKNK